MDLHSEKKESDRDQERADADSVKKQSRESRSDVVRLARGREEALKLDTWYGDGFGKMQALFKLERINVVATY
jgi:hypothetical protein